MVKNIWVAAGDGDLARVQELNFGSAISPNTPDSYTYTPMHAAASYGQIHILEYLISQGGDVNVTDGDGDTPLYTVENTETARFLVEHGAIVDRTNIEGVSPIDHLREDFPEVSNYLQSVSVTGSSGTESSALPDYAPPSEHLQNMATENLTTSLMNSVQDIMQRAEAEGRDPEAELRQVVSQTVLEGVVTGYELTTDGDERGPSADSAEDTPAAKRPKTNGGSE